ncbi:MAG TPA: bifunctional pyr operon transcriptional regulator/uracil phosphoribosyltransferase PyrR [Balneolales bacterium]|nr:bifunctional pyr operon transcriptional regulator/uracil phosphoribosyltransferase PyrR [Balneolales bacterium]
MPETKARLLSEEEISRILMRFAHQFGEPYDDLSNLAIIGMQTRGVYIAKRIQKNIKKAYGVNIPVGVLDVSFYRDDYRSKMKMPTVKVTEIPFNIYGKDLILVDDVLFTGRTVRSALDALTAFGRPKTIRFCCMIDRGLRELPITADYVGLHVPTQSSEEVRVYVKELDNEDAVYLVDTSNE